jgi:hypothetical protein
MKSSRSPWDLYARFMRSADSGPRPDLWAGSNLRFQHASIHPETLLQWRCDAQFAGRRVVSTHPAEIPSTPDVNLDIVRPRLAVSIHPAKLPSR